MSDPTLAIGWALFVLVCVMAILASVAAIAAIKIVFGKDEKENR
jgi:hypothetical protein